MTSWEDTLSKPWPIVIDDAMTGDEAGFLTKCDKAWRETDATIVGFLHSDLFIHEMRWDERVLSEFTKPDVAVAGFVGATGLGAPDLYKVPYHFTQLARSDVWSNLTDAEVHGGRDAGTKKVAVVDSCAVFVRRNVLVGLGGWPIERYPNSSHCSDLWLCCSVRRLGMGCVMLGIACTHTSGGKGEAGTKWMDAHYGSDTTAHRQAHELIYEDFRDVLPIRVKP